MKVCVLEIDAGRKMNFIPFYLNGWPRSRAFRRVGWGGGGGENDVFVDDARTPNTISFDPNDMLPKRNVV